ncbi:ribosomal RNA small subunit methyltransferase A [Kroppenstedtia guangzhouensis]|jgi:23S rRNA (adenine-N6)-dimethyltransferase|uniref:rRNA adenine N-6-methyltransferase n=1 Tax=Kroppenstedtia guangzhouensis TaxID=1274356 RepID=A0ABQ1GG01_9BACL|nr:23S ribosomal RNA methyltransferase Erm [Kroppenstedtia guangzhouensis]GGA43115.1 ribosomal RNA small subunit methyltransferase A [Kroppenstedtia guangzhouensis]
MNRDYRRHPKKQRHKEGANFPGQHLMHNKGLIKELIKISGVNRRDLVLEIGAGTGNLTLPLAEKSKKVLAVENDPVFAEKLQRKIKLDSNIEVIQRNFLQMNLPRVPFSVVANIPYSITTPILGKLFDQPGLPIRRAVLVVEKGAAKRFTADPITNPRILKWRMWFEMKMGRTIPPRNFSPPPRVDSAILILQRKDQPVVALHHHSRFMALATYGLKSPHLSVPLALKGVFTPPQLKHLLRHLKMDRDTPICSLTEDQWGVVFNTMIQVVPPFRWPK